MFEKLIASTYLQKMNTGRTTPLLVHCEATDENGNEHKVVIKLSGGNAMSESSLIREAVSSFFAIDLDIPAPCPFHVFLTEEFIESIHDSDARELATKSNRVAFGCELVDGANTLLTNFQVSSHRLTQAAQIYALDHMLGNSDRRPIKPNCLDNGVRYTVIDHEMCFTHMQVLFGGPKPWEQGNGPRSDMHGEQPHLFLEPLQKKELDFNGLEERLASLAHERIDQYAHAIPLDWGNSDYVAELVAYLKDVVDNAAPIFTEIRRTLA